MPEKEMTAPYSFAATNDERSNKSTADSVHEPNTIYKNNFEALELLRRYNSAKESAKSDGAHDLDLIRADQIEPVAIRWLWKNYFPFGKVSLLSGDPGEGKSTFILTVVALLTRGESLPFTEPEEKLDPMTVIYQTTEDDPEDTIVPRFIRANGDRTRLFFIKEDKKQLTFSDERIRSSIMKTEAKLFILDPISAYIGNVNMNAANEVRPQFSSLAQVAKETGCAIIVISHLNKAEGLKALYRIIGSVDISGSVRSITMIIRDPAEQDKRYFVQAKSNLAALRSGIAFRISEKGIDFQEEIEATAEELMKKFQNVSVGRPDDRMQEAADFIRKMLADNKPHPAAECESLLTDAGFKQGTIKKAKKFVDARSVKTGDLWNWYLPEVKGSISQ
ncbi:MAG: AAA family ATPase [Oscillospiraceae bacterium]|nr:AAA family ATPase [Oscillospiraceae bacterium]